MPAFRTSEGSESPHKPFPSIINSPSIFPSVISAPNKFKHPIIEFLSSPSQKFLIFADPLPIEFSNAALCDIDLSPGGEISPAILCEEEIV